MAAPAEPNKNDKKQRKLTKSPQISCETIPPMTGRSTSPSSWSLYGLMNVHTSDADAMTSNASIDNTVRNNAIVGKMGAQPKKTESQSITPENQSSTNQIASTDYR